MARTRISAKSWLIFSGSEANPESAGGGKSSGCFWAAGSVTGALPD